MCELPSLQANGNREFFGVHFINAGVMQGFDCPADSAIRYGEPVTRPPIVSVR